MYNIVFIDDEIGLCEVYEDLFEEEGLIIKAFSDPSEGLEYVNNNDIDLLFVDYRMPKIKGPELAVQVSKKIPIILLSGDLLNEKFENVAQMQLKPMSLQTFESIKKEYLK